MPLLMLQCYVLANQDSQLDNKATAGRMPISMFKGRSLQVLEEAT